MNLISRVRYKGKLYWWNKTDRFIRLCTDRNVIVQFPSGDIPCLRDNASLYFIKKRLGRPVCLGTFDIRFAYWLRRFAKKQKGFNCQLVFRGRGKRAPGQKSILPLNQAKKVAIYVR